MGDLVAEISLSGLLHLAQNHSGDFLSGELTLFALVFDGNRGLAVLLGNLEWPVLHVAFDFRFIHLATNETLRIKYGVLGIGVVGVFRRVTDTANS